MYTIESLSYFLKIGTRSPQQVFWDSLSVHARVRLSAQFRPSCVQRENLTTLIVSCIQPIDVPELRSAFQSYLNVDGRVHR